MEVVINLKAVGGRWDSFQNSPELLPFVDRSLVKSSEMHIEPEIMAYPFQTETSIAEWHYKTGMAYMDAKKVVQLLMENVSRNGTMLLNLTQHGRGDLDPEVIRTAKDIGAWLKVNGEAIYGSRPFEVYGGEGIYYLRKDGFVYAVISDWKDEPVTLEALHKHGNTLGNVSKVDMLGSDVAMSFVQDENGLTVTPSGKTLPISNIANESLASGFRVLRITHDKGWINDDDPGAVAPKWARISNLSSGDYNNDLTMSHKQGDVWRIPFTGKKISIIAPKETGYGTIEIKIDGKSYGMVNLSTEGQRLSQQVVFKVSDLALGEHIVEIINIGNGVVAIDALIAGSK